MLEVSTCGPVALFGPALVSDCLVVADGHMFLMSDVPCPEACARDALATDAIGEISLLENALKLKKKVWTQTAGGYRIGYIVAGPLPFTHMRAKGARAFLKLRIGVATGWLPAQKRE